MRNTFSAGHSLRTLIKGAVHGWTRELTEKTSLRKITVVGFTAHRRNQQQLEGVWRGDVGGLFKGGKVHVGRVWRTLFFRTLLTGLVEDPPWMDPSHRLRDPQYTSCRKKKVFIAGVFFKLAATRGSIPLEKTATQKFIDARMLRVRPQERGLSTSEYQESDNQSQANKRVASCLIQVCVGDVIHGRRRLVSMLRTALPKFSSGLSSLRIPFLDSIQFRNSFTTDGNTQ